MQDITQRKRSEKFLERIGRQNELILNSAGEGIYGLDLEGKTTFINPAAATMTGWEVKDLIGKPQHAILHHSRPDGTPYPREDCPIYAAFKDGNVHHVDSEVFWRKDGSSFPVEYISTPIWEGGNLVGVVVTFRDITERKLAEASLRESEARFAGILDIAMEAIISIGEDQRIIIFNKGAEHIFGYSQTEVIGQPINILLPERFRHAHHAHIIDFARSGVITQRMEERREIFGLRKSGGEFPAEASISKLGLGDKTILTVVLRDITERKEAEKALQINEQHFRLNLEKLVGERTCQLNTEVIQRKRVLEVLRESDARFRNLIETVPHGIEEINASGIINFANQGLHKIYSYDQGELIGKSILDFVATDSERKELANYLLKLVKEQPPTRHYIGQKLTKDGRIIDVQVDWNYKRSTQGQVIGFISVITDITERKQLEEKLSTSEALYRSLVEAAPQIIWQAEADGANSYINKAWEKMTGMSQKDALGSGWAEVLHPDDAPGLMAKWKRAYKRGESYRGECRFRAKDGSYRMFDFVGAPVRDAEGKIVRWVGINTDITERKLAEKQIRLALKDKEILLKEIHHRVKNNLQLISMELL